MALIDKFWTFDTCVYWAPTGRDRYGQRTYGTPVEIYCRWTDVHKEIKTAEGEVTISQAEIYVGQDLEVGGVLLHSELDSSVDQDDPKVNTGAWEIIQFDKIPNKRATKFVRKAYI